VSVSPFDSALLGGLFGDPETAAQFSDEAEIAAMVAVERALARAQARCGAIPAPAGAGIDRALADVAIAAGDLADGAAAAGVAVPALIEALRARLEPEARQWLHWGATSQDIVDSALALRLDWALAGFEIRLDRLIAELAAAAQRWADLPMAGRTRSQIAAPVAFGHRCARWAQPLIALREDLGSLRGRVARVQFGGAVGVNAAVAPLGPAISAALAEELGLADAPAWHTDRTAFGALGGWCAGLAAACAKMAGDLILMGRSESGEAAAGSGGGSSTMPQKANPVAAEAVVALARHAAALSGSMHLAAIHAEERDGAAWALEWLALPQLVVAAGACLRHATSLAGSLRPDPARLAAALALGGGSVMAEAASFALAERMPRAEAQVLVKKAVRDSAVRGETLAVALGRLAPGVEWPAALDPAGAMPASQVASDAIFAIAATVSPRDDAENHART
jgi:3-carboxy-cis,cis-muconate cycloisomerase